MDDPKQALREKAEAYQRRMQQAHALRLMEDVADMTRRLQAQADDVGTLAALAVAQTDDPVPDRDHGAR